MDTIDNQSQEKRYLRQKQTMGKKPSICLLVYGEMISIPMQYKIGLGK